VKGEEKGEERGRKGEEKQISDKQRAQIFLIAQKPGRARIVEIFYVRKKVEKRRNGEILI
jgi:hypothetical protein